MRYLVIINNPKQLANVFAALQIIDPDAEIGEDSPDYQLRINRLVEDTIHINLTDSSGQTSDWQYQDLLFNDPRFSNAGREQRVKEMIRLGVIQLLSREFSKSAPWGILSAVRPSKIFHYLREHGFAIEEIRHQLQHFYGIEASKVDLLIELSTKQVKFFKPANVIGIYIGIPFCPTRCQYCSFPAVPLTTHRHFVADFLDKLAIEIADTVDLCREMKFTIESIYIGGGTPTSLSDQDFAEMIRNVSENLRSQDIREFTVEAGRPETITHPKIDAMLQAGVTRISINPQSMNQATLDRIGRDHMISQVYLAVAMMKQTEFVLNMDLIAGLPGEGAVEFLDSLVKVIELDPDNITVHTLAPKRASAWRRGFHTLPLAQTVELVKAVEKGRDLLKEAGYFPYYLYRQRSILAGLENIGYAKPGMESVYNIQMMEERQTILGLGAGSVTKWIFGSEHHVVRHQNPKCPATYCQRIDEDLVKKAQQTRLLLD